MITNKVVLLGESHVGKSSLVARLQTKEFDLDMPSTIGAAFTTHSMRLSDGNNVTIAIWDTAGQERYRSIIPMYMRGARCALICFTEFNSKLCECYIDSVYTHSGFILEIPKVILVKTKVDISPEKDENMETYAKENNLDFFYTSAKTGENVGELFQFVAESCPTQIPQFFHNTEPVRLSQVKNTSCCN